MNKNCLYQTYLWVLLVVLSGPAIAAQTPDNILKAIVKIKANIPKDAATAQSLGTEREGNGVIIDKRGHILTIGYLILEAESIEVTKADGDQIKANFVAYDYQTGFGIIRAIEPLLIDPIRLGQSFRLKTGDPVLIAGYGGTEAVLGSRVVSRKEFTGYWEYLLEDAIYTSPPYPNYGGAALIDRDGQLLGIGSILTRIDVDGLGVIPCNMSVPIDLLKPILTDLIETGHSSAPPQPWLGVHADEAHGRVFIIRVTPEGPAAKAGINAGDVVVAVNQKPVKGLAQFFRQIWASGPAGVKVTLSILQETQVREISLQTADRHRFLNLSRQR
ncbi:MAG: serine protease [Deltaproteobacteria bacterium]|jgi:S1-C subfamily serine protease|nr:serine protease [Deltaproteobacteria bacterium]MBW2518096.1 serine protease [Deltaproteobacteria bacterium]